ncbi:MAG TPA: BadF/BadG/BcrA/BcrD ATPase family protein [Solirubrobacteraceae bacterium]|jgi:N-acetylglucosamine kinase-like BadF-type ATPase|nr:BadF/BadG/BcrA/BcrD ATPase family protein [Solirubrobacteraceae bacterium]
MDRTSLVQLPSALRKPARHPGARFVMGIDGGATKTLAAVLDLQERALHLAHGGPSNEDAIGVPAAVGALLATADAAIRRAGISQDSLARAVLAVAGTDTTAVARHVGEMRNEDWIVVNDVVGAWATATDARPGVAAISGTGSNVFGVGFEGQPWRAGGWGHLLGDEGGGYWFGSHSIRAALRDRDGSGPPTAISDALVEFFAVGSVEELAALVYSKPLTKSEIAAFAAHTCAAAEAGDAVAIELYRRGAAELARQINVVIERTGLAQGGDPFPVGLIGSGFRAGPVFAQPLAVRVHEQAPQATVSVVDMSPVAGSLLLAAHACGHPLQREELGELLDQAEHQPA